MGFNPYSEPLSFEDMSDDAEATISTESAVVTEPTVQPDGVIENEPTPIANGDSVGE